MANYTVRVVLHGATPAQYAALHQQMAKGGASRVIRADDGSVYDLPDGEYVLSNSLDAAGVMKAVALIASGVKASPPPSVLVTTAGDRAWQLRQRPAQS